MNTQNQLTKNEIRPGTDRELKVHDGIVGALILLSVSLGMYVNSAWLWLAGAIAVVMISSAFTGFVRCILYLEK